MLVTKQAAKHSVLPVCHIGWRIFSNQLSGTRRGVSNLIWISFITLYNIILNIADLFYCLAVMFSHLYLTNCLSPSRQTETRDLHGIREVRLLTLYTSYWKCQFYSRTNFSKEKRLLWLFQVEAFQDIFETGKKPKWALIAPHPLPDGVKGSIFRGLISKLHWHLWRLIIFQKQFACLSLPRYRLEV